MKIGVFVAVLVLVIIAAVLFIRNTGTADECATDSDCVHATCCHADSCVAKENAPSCTGIMCTEECSPNTMDCNQGSCLCQKNKCIANIK